MLNKIEECINKNSEITEDLFQKSIVSGDTVNLINDLDRNNQKSGQAYTQLKNELIEIKGLVLAGERLNNNECLDEALKRLNQLLDFQ